MFRDVQDRESVHFTLDKANRSFKFNSTSSATCITSVSVFTTNSGRSLSRDPSYQYQVTLNSSAKKELLWWVQNLKLCNGRCLVQTQAQMVIQADASKTGWRTSCQGLTTRRVSSKQERSLYINVLPLAVKLALLSFTKTREELYTFR